MAIYEIGDNPNYEELLRFAGNALQQDHEQRAAYTQTAAMVMTARKLDQALVAFRDRLMDAAQHVGKVTENQTRLMLGAYNRSVEASSAQAGRLEALSKGMNRATWVLAVSTVVLAVATVGLFIATIALYYKP